MLYVDVSEYSAPSSKAPMKMEQTQHFKTLEYKILTPGNQPKERIQQMDYTMDTKKGKYIRDQSV
jgi:hypothetical protein